jgi:membrane protease YdiL (CAAX protease family)
VLVGLAVGILATSLIAIAAAAGGSSVSHPSPAVGLITNLAFDLSFVGGAVYFAASSGRLRAADFGFRRTSLAYALGAMAIAAVGYFVLSALYSSLLNLHAKDKLPSYLGVHKSTAALAGTAVFVCVVAPILEETFFRGFIFGALRRLRITVAGREVGTWLAAIVTGILFGFAHVGSAAAQYLIPLAFLGFVLCLVRWRTRSLYPCMALHSINNSLALGINELHWSGAGIAATMAGALLVIAAITGPLSRRPARQAAV